MHVLPGAADGQFAAAGLGVPLGQTEAFGLRHFNCCAVCVLGVARDGALRGRRWGRRAWARKAPPDISFLECFLLPVYQDVCPQLSEGRLIPLVSQISCCL